MKFTNAFLLLPIVGVLKAPGSGSTPIIYDEPTLVDEYFYTSDYYGPFDGSNNETIKLYFKNCNPNHYLTIEYFNAATYAKLSQENYKLADIMGFSDNCSYTLRVKNKMYQEGIGIQFTINDGDSLTFDRKLIHLYPTENKTIYSFQYVNNPYVASNRFFKIGKDRVYQSETIQFLDTIDYLTNDKYNAIDISEIKFTYDKDIPLINANKNKNLTVYDYQNVYTNIIKNNYAFNIPVECVKNGNEISLRFLNTFYYNPITLDMSFIARDGYLPTDKFYIPKYGLKSLENDAFILNLQNFGYSKTNIVIPLSFIKDKNFSGMCGDSNYCVVGGIKE